MSNQYKQYLSINYRHPDHNEIHCADDGEVDDNGNNINGYNDINKTFICGS